MKKIIFLILAYCFCTYNGFTQWSQTNGPDGGFFSEIIETNSALFLNTGSGGVYKSVNNGGSWSPSNSGIPFNTTIYSLIEDNGILYISVDRNGVYTSIDSGINWVPINTGIETETFYSLLVDGNNIYAGNANGGITYSNNGGQNWSFIGGDLASNRINDFQIFNSKVYAGGTKLVESSDQGATWQEVSIEGININGIRTIHVDQGIFYVANDGSVTTSSDNLTTWVTQDINTFSTI